MYIVYCIYIIHTRLGTVAYSCYTLDSRPQKHMAHPTAYKSHTIHVDRFSVSLAVHLAASWTFLNSN